ncbi:MAG: hypothetical protein IKT41_01500 [Clostridia bacterium]|nr:hypothetical protein [Clostridia bacterium]
MSYLTHYQIEQLREKIDWDKWPLDLKDWPVELNGNTNCLSFALGIPIPTEDRRTYEPILLRNFIIEFCSAFNLNCREISSVSQAYKNEIVIQCYENVLPNGRFHVTRRNLNGKWVHKEGWIEAPCEFQFNGYFNCLYPPKSLTTIFAVRKKAS